MRSFIIIVIMLLQTLSLLRAQAEKNSLVAGNSAYGKGDYPAAEKHYREALEKKKSYNKASYNLGNTLYKQKKYEDAGKEYDIVLNSTNNKDTLSRVYHNMGNNYLKQKKYQEAVNAYKNSLKMNSKDEETRYNLAYALKKLQEQQKQNQQNQQQQQQKQQQEQQQQPQISKEDAKRMLEALKQVEKKIHEDKKEKGKKAKTDVEKDW